MELSLTAVSSFKIGSHVEFPKYDYLFTNILWHSTINVKNYYDHFCILYCIIIHKYRNSILEKNNGEESSLLDPNILKKYMKRINIPLGVTFPIKMGDIHLFEQVNNLNINVWGLGTEQNIISLWISSKKNNMETMDLLLLNNNNNNSHFALVTNVSNLVRVRRKQRRCAHICTKCFFFETNNKSKLFPQGNDW